MNESYSDITVEQLLRQEDWIRRLVRRLVRDESQADDIVQEAWVAALQNPPLHSGATRAWLKTVVRATMSRFRALEFGRTHRERAAAGSEAVRPAVDLLLEREERRRTVVEAVMRLAEPYRSTIILRYFEEMKPAAIASRDGVPLSTVKTRLQRSLDQLRTHLDADNAGDRRAWLVPLAALFLPREAATGAALTAGAATAAKTGAVSLLGAKGVAMAAGAVLLAALVAVPILLTGGEEQAPPETLPVRVESKAAPPDISSSPDPRRVGSDDRPVRASEARAAPALPGAVVKTSDAMIPAPPAIAGWVRWRSGAPVDRVFVQAVKAPDRVWEVETDRSGGFEFLDLPRGTFKIRVRSFSTSRQGVWGRFVLLKTDPEKLVNRVPDVTAFETGIIFGERESVSHGTRDLMFTVHYPVVLSGRVVDDRTNAPVEQLVPRINGTDGGRRLVDSEGRFCFVANGPASFRVQFLRCHGYLESEEQQVILQNGEHRGDAAIRMRQGGVIVGRVRRGDGGEVGPLRIVARTRDRYRGATNVLEVPPGGRFRLEGVEGTLSLRVESGVFPDLHRRGIRVSADQTVKLVELLLVSGGTLSLRITDNADRPIKGARVSAKNLASGEVSKGQLSYVRKNKLCRRSRVFSDKDGRWTHATLQPGDYRVRVSARNGELLGERECRILEGKTTTARIVLRPKT